MNADRCKTSIKLHEGLRLNPYPDTVGKWTIGYGRNLSDVGVSRAEAEFLFENDFQAAESLAAATVINFDALDDVRQEVLTEMAFNLGPRIREFKNMLAAVAAMDFAGAAKQMRDSLWYTQVKSRGEALAKQMETGEPVRE